MNPEAESANNEEQCYKQAEAVITNNEPTEAESANNEGSNAIIQKPP
jgi:hypothetical protein